MCLWVKRDARIAKKNIKVWKILDGDRAPYYNEFVYVRNKLHHSELKADIPSHNLIQEGLHSFIKLRRALYSASLLNGTNNSVGLWSKVAVHQMIIPKGAVFYIGHSGDIVSQSRSWQVNPPLYHQ